MPDPPLRDRLLRHYIERALRGQKDMVTAAAIAVKLDAGEWRIISSFVPDLEGQPDPDTLAYRVEVHVHDGWAELCTIEWKLLALEWADVLHVVENTQRQYAVG
jgi:hypothetical protein